jgi:hypothetical protein
MSASRGVVSLLGGCILAAAAWTDGEGSQNLPAAPSRPSQVKAVSQVDVCALLTPSEIAAVTGAKVSEIKPDSHGAVGTCNYQVGEQLFPVVTLVLAPNMPKVSSSAEMAAWRSKQGTSFGDVKIIITPVEGLGVPAIHNEVEGTGLVTVEAAAKGMLLDVTTSSLEMSKALAVKAIARIP